MKKVIFSLSLLMASAYGTGLAAQVSVSVRIGGPVYCPAPPVLIVAPPPRKVVVVRPAPAVVVAPPPVCVVTRPRRGVIIYR